MKILHAKTTNVEYPVYIGDKIVSHGDLLNNYICNQRGLIVTDQNIADLYLDVLLQQINQKLVDVVILEPGEENKNLTSILKIIDALILYRHDRDSTIISFGGGLIGDLTGFAASIYMRGVHWVQIPTTLLSQVDAGLGGKTGFNYSGIKNLLGTFYQPKAVLIDICFLQSVSDRELFAGLAEVIKYGMACDGEFFIWLEQNIRSIIARDTSILLQAIERCCYNKLRIVAVDEYDNGARMALNFGHTFAHALEAATNFNVYLHGEAVAIGMLLATQLAVRLGHVEGSLLSRLENMLSYLALPLQIDLELHNPDRLCALMMQDKKNRGQNLNLILPCALGAVRVVKVDALEDLEELFKDYASF